MELRIILFSKLRKRNILFALSEQEFVEPV